VQDLKKELRSGEEFCFFRHDHQRARTMSSWWFGMQYALYTFDPIGRIIHRGFLRDFKEAGKQTHSLCEETVRLGPHVDVKMVPYLDDNYAYIIRHEPSKKCALVDPADPEVVLAEVDKLGLEVEMILTTHYHQDHAYGNFDVKKRFPGAKVFGGKEGKLGVPELTDLVQTSSKILFADRNVEIYVQKTPGHTRGSVTFLLEKQEGIENPAVFSGDTLFSMGCGKFFECTSEEMLSSLKFFKGIDPEALLFCGHEGTLENLQFANWLVRDSEAMQEKLAWARTRRHERQPTVPSTIGTELELNVFMQFDDIIMRVDNIPSAWKRCRIVAPDTKVPSKTVPETEAETLQQIRDLKDSKVFSLR